MGIRNKNIPVNTLPEGTYRGIMVMREAFDGAPGFEEVARSHRDGGYTFIIQEKGRMHIEIDFQTYCIQAPSVIFIRPDQVHRLIAFEDAFISTSIITEDNIRAEYLNPLQNLAPAKPLVVSGETMDVLSQAAALCVKLSEKKDEKLYHAILQESCQTLVAIVVSQYLATAEGEGPFIRAGEITRSFKAALEIDFREVKSPAAYADGLHISTSYLNECVKSVTGKSVSAHIQHRVMLEAKRMLYHSNQPIKVIAAELGYNDHSYFIRLFVKLTGSTPVVFRDGNRE